MSFNIHYRNEDLCRVEIYGSGLRDKSVPRHWDCWEPLPATVLPLALIHTVLLDGAHSCKQNHIVIVVHSCIVKGHQSSGSPKSLPDILMCP